MVRLSSGKNDIINYVSILIAVAIIISTIMINISVRSFDNYNGFYVSYHNYLGYSEDIPLFLFPGSLCSMMIFGWPGRMTNGTILIVVNTVALASMILLWRLRSKNSLRSQGLLLAGYAVLSLVTSPFSWLLAPYLP